MCNFEVTLAADDDNRNVTCSQSNAIYLTWDYVRLSLSYGEFARLAKQVERQKVVVTEGGRSTVTDAVQVTYDKFSFQMPATDYAQFADLVVTAFTKLNGRAPQVVALQHGSHVLDTPLLPYDFLPN